jgi:hypothetical protein
MSELAEVVFETCSKEKIIRAIQLMEISNISDFEINGEARTNLSYIDEVFPILENELSDYAFFMFSFVKKN